MLALAVAAFALVACNGDGDNGDDDPTQTGGTTATATSTTTATTTATSTATATATETGTATSTPSGGAGGTLQVQMIDINYDPKELTATVDEEVTIEFENTGALEHTFTIDEISADDVTEEYQGDEADIDVVLQPGESGTLSFTPTEAGEFEFYCTVPGHREAGMVGTLTVE